MHGSKLIGSFVVITKGRGEGLFALIEDFLPTSQLFGLRLEDNTIEYRFREDFDPKHHKLIPSMDSSMWLPIHHTLCRAYSKSRRNKWKIEEIENLIERHIFRLCELTQEEAEIALRWFQQHKGILKSQHRRR